MDREGGWRGEKGSRQMVLCVLSRQCICKYTRSSTENVARVEMFPKICVIQRKSFNVLEHATSIDRYATSMFPSEEPEKMSKPDLQPNNSSEGFNGRQKKAIWAETEPR
jgi:hypothetical protein